VALGLLLASLLLVVCPCAFALDPALDVNEYGHMAWKLRDGFFKGNIFAITQTSDGYLWLGTEFGLLRFDGVRAVAWQPPPGQHLPDNFVRLLRTSHDGTLWIGTNKGLASWKDGKLTEYPELTGAVVDALLEDRQGTIWVGASAVAATSGRLCSIRVGALECHGEDGRFGRYVGDFHEDGEGTLWVAAENGLWRWWPGPPKLYPTRDRLNLFQSLAEGDSRSILVSTTGGVWQFADGQFKPYSASGAVRGSESSRLFRDRDGGLWIGPRGKALVHVHQGKTDVFGTSDGLTGDDFFTLFEDRERNIWISTADGLDLFRETAVRTLTLKQGLLNREVGSVLADRDGTVWLGTFGGLNRWKNGEITIPSTGNAVHDGKVHGRGPTALFGDDRGRLWVSTFQGLGYLESDQFVALSGVPIGAVHSIVEDRGGDVWVAIEPFGLVRLTQSNKVQKFPVANLRRKDYPTAMAVDPVRDGLWIGFAQSGIAYLAGGQIRESYSSADGLGDGYITDIRIDSDGTLWAATRTGLSRLKNGRIATLTSKNGLPCDTVHWSIEDDDRSLWLYTACGLQRIAHSDLEAWATDPKRTVAPAVFDNSDGVRALAYPIGYSPKVAKSLDGKLWFLPGDGASIIDPRHLPFNKLPAPVHVEQISADHNVYWQNSWGDRTANLHLPAQIRDLEIDYTALSYVAPEKVHFRYKLEGWDNDWQWVGNRRQAFYTNLSPGDYRFRVSASNNSGVWNEAGTSFAFSIAPAYYQTTWFRLSCVAAFLAMLWALYQLRLRQAMQRVRHRMEGRLVERERIARELHDTLLQSVQGLILKFDAVAKQIPRDEPTRLAMDEALDRADEVMGEGRERVRNLRAGASALTDLPAAFQRVADETAPGREATFKTIVEGSVRELKPMILEESYSIGREALINALAHSGGLHVEVEIIYDPRQFRLRVRDDGRGVDPGILEKGGRPGHWGMQGMRERAQGMGAQLGLWSRPGSGTEVELSVPAATAYKSGRAPAKTSWLGRVSGNGR
jgi:ligand-binding sensor domain-containing protein/signal transduction histidine kinase